LNHIFYVNFLPGNHGIFIIYWREIMSGDEKEQENPSYQEMADKAGFNFRLCSTLSGSLATLASGSFLVSGFMRELAPMELGIGVGLALIALREAGLEILYRKLSAESPSNPKKYRATSTKPRGPKV
jgi:hypothetical protein